MATQYNPVFLRDYTAAQQIRISLADINGIYLIPLKRIVYLQASGPYTNFYIAGKKPTEPLQLIVVSRNLGQYKRLYQHGFAQPNKSFIVNSAYIEHIASGSHLTMACVHPFIHITDDYVLPFKQIIGLPCKSKTLPAPNRKP